MLGVLAPAVSSQLAGASPEDAFDLPMGPAFFTPVERPRDPRRPACSFRLPVCVHGDSAPADVVLGTLADLELAASRLMDGAGLPTPLIDGARGGGPAFDLYLVGPGAPALGGAPSIVARDEPVPGAFDSASAFALLRRDVPAGCVRQNLVARAFAGAIQFRLDAGEDPVVRESTAAYLAELVAPCGVVTSDLVDDFQAHPERALTAAGGADPAAAMALPWYLDTTLGSGSPGALPVALASLGAQRTPASSLFWQNEPDFLDVLRGVLKTKTPPVPLADFWLDFAVARVFIGARDDGFHFPGTAFLGNYGRVRFDWSIDAGSLPRRLSPERPIDPTGSTYLWFDLRGAPADLRLAFRIEWEGPVLFRWALVRVRPDGTEASRIVVTPQQRSTSAEKNLDDLAGLAGVVLVGVNTGDLRLDDPFDPDIAPYEPHSYVVTIAAAP